MDTKVLEQVEYWMLSAKEDIAAKRIKFAIIDLLLAARGLDLADDGVHLTSEQFDEIGKIIHSINR